MIQKTSLLSSMIFYFLVSSCCNHKEIDTKIGKLEAKRDSLLNVEEASTFEKLKDFEMLQALEDTTKEYAIISKQISTIEKVSTERSALIIKVDKQIIDLQKQINTED